MSAKERGGGVLISLSYIQFLPVRDAWPLRRQTYGYLPSFWYSLRLSTKEWPD